ncbi:CheR family methyltransferase [Roseofilum capinflatum]|uniref:protein-glutamate O-methyltransferase n=1 Tax=Roseofilum capinflatum BLCC-M114 TaxID=3022440 RepID=A0ABT7B301_9CYAN|nr:CheR family methyltransferase [Roseofilum capinflatum]MDJ1173510.1 hypothetical protein [Roseofilum capinflatum BLCC-M114]
MINVFLLEQLIQLINHKTGLAIRSKDRDSLCQKIIHRTRCLRMSSVEDYYQLLVSHSDRSDREWKLLIDLLTTGESYFFRDQGQIEILRTNLLPELINNQRHQASTRGDRLTLQVWSAGCSTGEEVYSLAILLMELIPDWRNWHLRVLGTDINAMAIAKANTGLYNDWSFRLVDPKLKDSYFQPHQKLWKIKSEVQKIVQFQSSNLILDPIPQENGRPIPFDLIICRNVFIYFTKKAIDICLEKFCQALKSKAYLMTSHTELYGHNLNCLEVKVLPASIIYQKKCSLANPTPSSQLQSHPSFPNHSSRYPAFPLPFAPTQSSQHLSSHPSPLKSHTSKTPIAHTFPPKNNHKNKEIETLFKQKQYTNTIEKSLQYLKQNPKDFILLLSIAKSYANLGQLELAIQYANECLSISSFAIDPYYLLAQISEEKGDLEQAKLYLKRIIYLEPEFIPAYLDLGSLYAHQGNKIQARKFWTIALGLLQKHPQDAKIVQLEEYTPEELLSFLKKRLKELQ